MAMAGRKQIFWPMLVGAVLMVCTLAVISGVDQLVSAQTGLDLIEAANRDLMDRNQALYRQIERLRSDDRALAKTIRSEMGMIGKHEVIYRPSRPKRQKETQP